MTKSGPPSHRCLGPVRSSAARAQRLQRDADTPRPGGYHNFAGISPARLDLGDALLLKLAGAIVQNTARAGTQTHLNSPDRSGAPGLPAGYTYLWQLAGHDLAMTRVTGGAALFGADPENLRRRPLEMETLLGDGAMADPQAYLANGGHLALRTGRMRQDRHAGGWDWCDPARDLPRTCQQGTDARGLDVVLIPDARNDDNLILAQLTALFHHAANLILAAARAKAAEDGSDPEILGRMVLGNLWRRILRQDLLQRLLHPEVHARYAGRPARLDTGANGGRPSAEFVFAAVRLGHGLVRDSYRLNTAVTLPTHALLRLNASDSPELMPHRAQYLIDWNLFFPPADGTGAPDAVNWAFRFGPHLAADLGSRSAAVTTGPETTPVNGTAFRDLMREADARLAGAAQLVAAIRRTDPGLAGLIAPNGDALGALVGAGLDRLLADDVNFGHHKLTAQERAEVLANPPLSLLLMFEAEQNGNGGRTLGPLGSVLVAEGMWPVLAPLPDALATVFDSVEAEALGTVVSDMPGLLASLRRQRPDIFPQAPTANQPPSKGTAMSDRTVRVTPDGYLFLGRMIEAWAAGTQQRPATVREFRQQVGSAYVVLGSGFSDNEPIEWLQQRSLNDGLSFVLPPRTELLAPVPAGGYPVPDYYRQLAFGTAPEVAEANRNDFRSCRIADYCTGRCM